MSPSDMRSFVSQKGKIQFDENHLGWARRRSAQVVIRGTVVKRTHSPIDWVSHHREIFALPAQVMKSVSAGRRAHRAVRGRSESKRCKTFLF